jgi:predicted transcriptional regulator
MRLRKKQVKAIVSRLLKEGEITEPPIPVDRVARDLGLHVRHVPFEGEISGSLIRSGEDALVGVNSMHHENRQRFTLAHEIGHFLLHKGDRVILDRSFRVNLRDTNGKSMEDPEEIEANFFAAELLMPEEFLVNSLRHKKIDIEEDDIIETLANKYKVSPQAMAYRLVNLGFLR